MLRIMTVYRTYLLNHEARIFHGEDLEAVDDDAAIAAGAALIESHNSRQSEAAHGFEIWRGGALIFSTSPGRA